MESVSVSARLEPIYCQEQRVVRHVIHHASLAQDPVRINVPDAILHLSWRTQDV